MNSYTALLLLATIGLSSALVDEGTCPTFTNVASFSLEQYAGRWFEIERFADVFETEAGCAIGDYTLINETTCAVQYSGVYPDGTSLSATGVSYTTDVSGELVAVYPGQTNYYNVLDTDYTSYSCVYFCEELIEGRRQQYAYILSRTPTMTPTELDAAWTVFRDNGIDIDDFLPTHQGEDCTYLPPPPAPTAAP